MPKFSAIPVGRGDAFYLDRDEWSVLVDGGLSRNGFGKLFPRITAECSVDVLVCTHNDADHAGGVLGFLEANLECREVWLPGRWLGTLHELLRPFAYVVGQLAEQIEQEERLSLEESVIGVSTLEQIAMRALDEPLNEPHEGGAPLAEDGWPMDFHRYLSDMDRPDEWKLSDSLRRGELRARLSVPFDHPRARVLELAIDAAQRIRAIAFAAFKRAIPVRWFQYDTRKPMGGCRYLRPLNSREISRSYPSGLPLLAEMALSVANKESLVFWSPPSNGTRGVLFTADSDLATTRIPRDLKGAIVTAPHHGSDSNCMAYDAVQAAAKIDSGSLVWVRSDANDMSRPGQSFRDVEGRRICTVCSLGGDELSPKQEVRCFSRGRSWVRHPSTSECTCW